MLRSQLVSCPCLSLEIPCLSYLSVVFRRIGSYMNSPDAANLGIIAVYVCAGLLVPFAIILASHNPETYNCTYQELDKLYQRKFPAQEFRNTSSLSV
ncbi:hypothetical protein D6D17_02339 [Aureobasidium pullulans]|nr:hypothetical protein D6D17_02339 [Aureobasidium pullulans]